MNGWWLVRQHEDHNAIPFNVAVVREHEEVSRGRCDVAEGEVWGFTSDPRAVLGWCLHGVIPPDCKR